MRDYEIDRLVRLEGTNYDRRRKLSVQDVNRIRKLYFDCHLSISTIASIYDVCYITIKYHIDSTFKKDLNKQRTYYKVSDVDANAQRANRIEYKRSILKSMI